MRCSSMYRQREKEKAELLNMLYKCCNSTHMKFDVQWHLDYVKILLLHFVCFMSTLNPQFT